MNPHKWLGASFDCSTYFIRDPQHLVRVMSPSYLRTSADAEVVNYRDGASRSGGACVHSNCGS
ncbi:MAG: hypothetical protein U1F11_05035 [Steroidobacteraceae bacterium]